ncbi:MAG TPA: hypothetical protein VGH19_07970 [Verrucomicrobiae bacterium]
MSTISPLRMALWVIAIMVACGLFVSGSSNEANTLIAISSLLLITRSEMKKPVSRRDGLTIIAIIPGIFLLQFFLFQNWSKEQIETVMTHPAFVFPMWGLIVVLSLKKWRRDRLALDSPQAS